MLQADLATRLATQYGIDPAAAATAVDTYAGQISDDPDLYDGGVLTEAGADIIARQFAADYDTAAPGTVTRAHAELRDQITETARRIDDLTARRDETISERDGLIRQAIAAGVRVDDIAADARLKPARIYQIRDGRR